jgi:hypothetical protein
MKWTKKQPGVYVSGNWTIRNAGADWEILLCDEPKARRGTKRDAQAYVEEEVFGEPDKAKVDSTESVLASLRLEVSRLAETVAMLSTAVTDLADQIRKR